MIDDVNRLTKKAGQEECWIWMGCIKNEQSPYGEFRWNRKLILAHRFVYEIANSMTLKKGQCVLHKCDNPRCVNPSHLVLGTHLDNMKDMFKKNRRLRWPSEIARAKREGIAN